MSGDWKGELREAKGTRKRTPSPGGGKGPRERETEGDENVCGEEHC